MDNNGQQQRRRHESSSSFWPSSSSSTLQQAATTGPLWCHPSSSSSSSSSAYYATTASDGACCSSGNLRPPSPYSFSAFANAFCSSSPPAPLHILPPSSSSSDYYSSSFFPGCNNNITPLASPSVQQQRSTTMLVDSCSSSSVAPPPPPPNRHHFPQPPPSLPSNSAVATFPQFGIGQREQFSAACGSSTNLSGTPFDNSSTAHPHQFPLNQMQPTFAPGQWSSAGTSLVRYPLPPPPPLPAAHFPQNNAAAASTSGFKPATAAVAISTSVPSQAIPPPLHGQTLVQNRHVNVAEGGNQMLAVAPNSVAKVPPPATPVDEVHQHFPGAVVSTSSHQTAPAATNNNFHSAQQREQRRCLTSQQKVQQWQNFGHQHPQQLPPQDSGVHSMSQSTAPSVMSMSSIHPISCISTLSSLPDECPGTAFKEHPYLQHIPSSIRHEEPEKMRQVLPELIPLINDESEEIVLRALTILSSIARKDKELCLARLPLGGPLIAEKRVVEELLRTLRTYKKNKKIACYVLRSLHFISDNEPSGRELFVQTLSAHGTGCLEELVQCIGIQEHSCFKYAFLVLHNLMSDPRIGKKVIAYMCEMRVLTKVIGWLGDRNEKFLNIVTDILHMLVSRNSDQMAFFIALNGHQMLVSVLSYSQQETLLYRVVKLLNRVVQLEPSKMIAACLLEAAQKHLDQASQRLLRQLLDCIRAASHVPCTGHDVKILLQKLLQLLGTNDIRLKECCTDILANLSANNAGNKEFLVEIGAVYGLFQLLHELEALSAALGPSPQREGIEERALGLLRSLCAANPKAGVASRQALSTDAHKCLLLQRLFDGGGGSQQQQKRKNSWPLLRRTLMLLQQFTQEGGAELLAQFRISSLSSSSHPPTPFPPQLPDAPPHQQRPPPQNCCSSFVSQIVLLLTETMMTTSCSSPQPQSVELCQRCLDLLRTMAAGDSYLLSEIFGELYARCTRLSAGQPRLLAPQVLLRFSDQLGPGAVALLAELARIPEAAALMGRDRPTRDSLQRWAANATRSANCGGGAAFEASSTERLALQTLQMINEAGGKVAARGAMQQPFHHSSTCSPFTGMMEFSPAPPSNFIGAPISPSSSSSTLLHNDGSNEFLMRHHPSNSGHHHHSLSTEQQQQQQQHPEHVSSSIPPSSIAASDSFGREESSSSSSSAFFMDDGGDFYSDFGPFLNALCPSPAWGGSTPRGVESNNIGGNFHQREGDDEDDPRME